MTFRPTLDFLLYDWLDVESLRERERFADHSRETFDVGARHLRADRAREVRAVQPRSPTPRSRGSTASRCILPQASTTRRGLRESGMLAAAQDYEIGGMQLPPIS